MTADLRRPENAKCSPSWLTDYHYDTQVMSQIFGITENASRHDGLPAVKNIYSSQQSQCFTVIKALTL